MREDDYWRRRWCFQRWQKDAGLASWVWAYLMLCALGLTTGLLLWGGDWAVFAPVSGLGAIFALWWFCVRVGEFREHGRKLAELERDYQPLVEEAFKLESCHEQQREDSGSGSGISAL